MSRESRLPILMMFLCVQMMLIAATTGHRSGGYSLSIDHEVMLNKFKPCDAKWMPRGYAVLHEEKYICDGDKDEDRGVVYHSQDEAWTGYGWGMPAKTFSTKEEAKKYIEDSLAYWLRPKAKWWKFWKEFDGPEIVKP